MALDAAKIAADLVAHLNLDDAELSTVTDLVTRADSIVKHTGYAGDDDNPDYCNAVTTLATQLYYDRTLSTGLSKGALMMLTALQAQAGLTTTTTAKVGEANG